MLNFKEQANQLNYEKVIVMGVVPFKNVIDGNQIDVCNVFIVAPFDESKGAIGFGVAKVKFGESLNAMRFRGIAFPANIEVAFQQTTNSSGKAQRIIKDIRIPKPLNLKE